MTTANAKILKLRPAVAPEDAGARLTLDDAIALALARTRLRGRSAHTEDNYAYHWRKLRDWCASRNVFYVRELTADLLVDFWQDLRADGYAPQTVASSGAVIGVLLLTVARAADYAPAAKLWANVQPDLPHATKEVQPAFAEAEVRALLQAAADGSMPWRDVPMILCLLDTGLRVSEIAALTVADVNLQTGETFVKSGKGKKTRVVFLSRPTLEAVRMCVWAQGAGPHDPVFGSRNGGGHLVRGSLNRRLDALAKAAGLEDVHPHKFRRTCAISWLRNGGDLARLAALLGHNGLRTLVSRYLPLAQTDLQDAHAQYGAVERLHVDGVALMGMRFGE